MKWMLVVLVFGVTPMETGLSYNSLDDCLKAEERMRADWDHILKARKKQYSEMPSGPNYVAQQGTPGTCIPHADRTP
jgi:hypothetical protein